LKIRKIVLLCHLEQKVKRSILNMDNSLVKAQEQEQEKPEPKETPREPEPKPAPEEPEKRGWKPPRER
jgi:hypothetical protein